MPSSRPATPGGLEITVEGTRVEMDAFINFLVRSGRFRPLESGRQTEPTRGRVRRYMRLAMQTSPTPSTTPEEETLVP